MLVYVVEVYAYGFLGEDTNPAFDVRNVFINKISAHDWAQTMGYQNSDYTQDNYYIVETFEVR